MIADDHLDPGEFGLREAGRFEESAIIPGILSICDAASSKPEDFLIEEQNTDFICARDYMLGGQN